MDELGMVFKGSLPAYEVDETKVQQGDIRAGMQDCLAEQEQVKALAFRFEKYLAECWHLFLEDIPRAVYSKFLLFMLLH